MAAHDRRRRAGGRASPARRERPLRTGDQSPAQRAPALDRRAQPDHRRAARPERRTMTAERQRSYRFSTAAQWSSCLVAQADRRALHAGEGVRPLAPYATCAVRHESRGAWNPVVTHAGEVLWIDDACRVHRLGQCTDPSEITVAPAGMGRASRIVATSRGLWVFDVVTGTRERYEVDSLTRLETIDGVDGMVDI